MACPKPATGANTQVFYVEEVDCGVLPTNPVWTPLRFTGGIPQLQPESLDSSELAGIREVVNSRSGNYNVAGDINCELSYGTFDTFFAAALQSSWVADDPEAGQDSLKTGSTTKSFSFMIVYNDLPGGVGCDIITGVEIIGFALSVGVNAYATVTWNTIGRDYAANQAEPSGSTYNPVSTTRPFTGIDASSINAGGSALGFVTSVSPTNENAGEPSFALGSRGVSYISYGRAGNTFTIEGAFSDYVMFERLINETEFDFDFTLELDTKSYKFVYPRCKATSGGPDVADEGTITETIETRALYDETEGSSIVIIRDPDTTAP